jgi:hypothetical protein
MFSGRKHYRTGSLAPAARGANALGSVSRLRRLMNHFHGRDPQSTPDPLRVDQFESTHFAESFAG